MCPVHDGTWGESGIDDPCISLPAATERILQRLQRFPSPTLPPALQPVVPPVPDIAPALLTDKMAAIHLLDADLAVLTEFTK